jgi:hypothetical protein
MQPTDALDHEPLDPDATPEGRLIIARRVAGMTRATWAKLKPQVANVVRALRAAGHVADAGLSDEDLAAAMSLKATKNVEMLQAAFEAEPDNIPRVLGVMARFKAATETLGGAERAEGFEADALQALKHAALFLARFHEAVKADPLLAELFPPPEVLQAEPGHALF